MDGTADREIGPRVGTPMILKLVVLGAVAAGFVLVWLRLRHAEEEVVQTADDIEAEFDALDPVGRAGVAAKLAKDAVKDVRARST